MHTPNFASYSTRKITTEKSFFFFFLMCKTPRIKRIREVRIKKKLGRIKAYEQMIVI